jgi:hypothetical protein
MCSYEIRKHLKYSLNNLETTYIVIETISNTQLYYYLLYLGTNLYIAVRIEGLIAFNVLIDLITSPTNTLILYFLLLVICVKPIITLNVYVNARECAIDS